MNRWYWCAFAVGCGDPSYSICQQWRGDEERRVLDSLDGTAIQVVPATNLNPSLGTGIAVFIHGGWESPDLPLVEESPSLRDDMGFTTIYLELPSDMRGSASRSTLAAALRYAAGEEQDDSDCTLQDRLPVDIAQDPVIAGFSNGGNLAWNTAGDDLLDLPTIAGIATFETPVSAGFVLGEPGTAANPNDRFDADLCEFDDHHRFSCPFPVDDLAFSNDASCADTDGCLFLDSNANGRMDPNEKKLGSIFNPESNRFVQSPWITTAAEDAGILPQQRSDSAGSLQFWSTREATQAMASAATRFPHIGGIATGTEVDHVLDVTPPGLHVNAMGQAMIRSGIPYTRLHPGAKWMQTILENREPWQDNPPNGEINLNDPMEPEDNQGTRGTDYLSAAVAELLDRSRTMDVSDVPK